MSLQVIEAGGLATIQDSGRRGWRRFGVPLSGPMDGFAFQAANRLVGNSADCAAIEVGLGDIVFQAQQDCVVAVAGCGYSLSVYAWDLPLWGSFLVRAGWTIRLNKVDTGMWAYLAVAGCVSPFDTAQGQPVLGSRSTNLRGGFGGFDGRALQSGDILRTVPLRSSHEFVPGIVVEEARPRYSDQPIIHFIVGPQAKNFTAESFETFISQQYKVSRTSDRMGYRLEGPSLNLRNPKELVSEGMSTGSIQVPASGQPIVMMTDGPTTGGYSKIGAVISADLPLLAQCVPNRSTIRFQTITVAKAQKKYRELMNGIDTKIIRLEENDAWY